MSLCCSFMIHLWLLCVEYLTTNFYASFKSAFFFFFFCMRFERRYKRSGPHVCSQDKTLVYVFWGLFKSSSRVATSYPDNKHHFSTFPRLTYAEDEEPAIERHELSAHGLQRNGSFQSPKGLHIEKEQPTPCQNDNRLNFLHPLCLAKCTAVSQKVQKPGCCCWWRHILSSAKDHLFWGKPF